MASINLSNLKNQIRKYIYVYLSIVGFLVHLFGLTLSIVNPILFSTILDKFVDRYYDLQYSVKEVSHFDNSLSVEDEINKIFKPWQPLNKIYPPKKGIWIKGKTFKTITEALAEIKSGETLEIGEGVYHEAFRQKVDDITIVGFGHVIFDNAIINGKGYILNTGANLTVKNIECRNISVNDKNGACIRQEGVNLTLEHVYFNRSENGILETTGKENDIFIYDSRFELLGKGGRAHGIYATTANLYIYDSLFLASKGEGHEIKNRGPKTEIYHSIIASLSSRDSRLIDIANGGELKIINSILEQGPNTSNGQAIGFALEGNKHDVNTINLEGNIIILERNGNNVMFSKKGNVSEYHIKDNVLVSESSLQEFSDHNLTFNNRKDANLPVYPMIPEVFCTKVNCVLNKESH